MGNIFLGAAAAAFLPSQSVWSIEYFAQGHFSKANTCWHTGLIYSSVSERQWGHLTHLSSTYAFTHSLTHSSQLAFVFFFWECFFLVRALRRAGEYPSMPRVERRVTLSQGEHRGILKITHTHTCRQSGVSVSHDLLDRLLPVGGNRSILNKPTQNVEERETPNEKKGHSCLVLLYFSEVTVSPPPPPDFHFS